MIATIAGAMVVFSCWRLVAHIHRPFWIDEFYNLLKIWKPDPDWLIQNNWLETAFLAPLRAFQDNPATGLIVYRWLNLLLLPVVCTIGYARLRHRHTSATLSLLAIAGTLTMGWMSSYFIVARPTALAIGGLIVVFADNWRTRWTWLGVALTALQPIFLGFLIVERFVTDWRNYSNYLLIGLIAGLALSPMILGKLASESWGIHIFPTAEIAVNKEVTQLAPFQWLNWLQEETRSSTLAIIILLMVAVRRLNFRVVLAPILYVGLLFGLQKLGFMIFFRYTLPIPLWVWFHLTPQLAIQEQMLVHSRRFLLLLTALSLIQIVDSAPLHRHWESVKLRDVSDDQNLSWTKECNVVLQADTLLGLMVALDLYLSFGKWDLNSPGDPSLVVIRRCGPIVVSNDATRPLFDQFTRTDFMPFSENPPLAMPILHVDYNYHVSIK